MTALAQESRTRRQNRRRSERFALEQTTTISVSTADGDYRCCLQDISYGGLRVSFDDRIPQGEQVAVEHGFVGTLQGKLAWREGRAMGIELQVAGSELQHALQCVGLLVSPDGARGRERTGGGAGKRRSDAQ